MNNPYVKTLEPVWQNLDDVFINDEKLQELIKNMKQKKENGELGIPAWAVLNAQPPMDCKPASWIDYICWVNTVNFAFTNFKRPWNKFIVEYPKGSFWSGSFASGVSFWRFYQENGIEYIDPEYMAKISLEETKHLFRAIDSRHQIPMLEERRQIFQEVGKVLLEKYNGVWIKLFVESSWRAFNKGEGIVERLTADFPSFRDERAYSGHILKFNKRAQLLALMYHGRAVHSRGRMPEIEDIEDIGPIADYAVPKALRFLGVLEYSRDMESFLQNHRVFLTGNRMEIENRLAMSYVVKRICDEAEISMAQADYYIWEIGRKSKEPHILVPTKDY